MATIAPVPDAAEPAAGPAAADETPFGQYLSVQQCRHSSYKPDCDLVDGYLEDRNPGERTHSELQGELLFQFRLHKGEWRIVPLLEQRVQVRADRFRVCDLATVRTDAPREDIAVRPPLLCIEVLSPEDRMASAERVLADRRAMGVPQSWLFDPIRRAASTYDEAGLRPVDSDRLQLPGTPIFLLLSELFAVLD